MAEESVLSDEFLRQLINVGEVDLLVAVPTHNHAQTIASVAQAVRLGLLKYFPRDRAVLVNTDLGSRDGSRELARQAADTLPSTAALQSLRTFHTVTAVCGNGTGGASPLRLLLAASDLLQAKACAVVWPSEHVTPEWMERLLAPIYRKNFDLVTPRYQRHKFDGLLVRILLYPLLRALLGRRIHEPYSTDFGFSGRWGADMFAKEELWRAPIGEMGEPLLLTMSAVADRCRTCEVFLGVKAPGLQTADVVEAMRQTVGPMFAFLDANYSRWEPIHGSEPVPLEGSGAAITSEPRRINPHRLREMFRSGVADLRPVLGSILTPQTLADLSSCAGGSGEPFCFPDELWARAVYEFAAAYHRSVINRDHIVQALTPLYRGKVYESLVSSRHADAAEVEARGEALCQVFEQLKPYLLQLWKGNEGGAS